jgi:amidase
MPLTRPGKDEFHRIADMYGFDLPDHECDAALQLAAGTLASYDRLDQISPPRLPVKYPRDAGRAPSPEENPHNAWAWRCEIKGAESGKLAGKKIALKDNICLAGMPLLNGSAMLEGFIPNEDATVVTRILDAGGEIVGKAVCENFCFSGGSHTSHPAPVLNPANPEYSTGGSSSGSAALVATGAVDMALGGDQGGSIRMPASWSGIVGLKPTFGLVPYTGIFPIEGTLDHTGPMAASVSDAALLLEVIAGEDGLDPRQVNVKTAPYTQALGQGISGIKVGVVREGFGWEGSSEEAVDRVVKAAARAMSSQGAQVSDISIPMHRDGIHIWTGIALEGATAQMVRGDGAGWNYRGHYLEGLCDFYGRARRARANDFPLTVKSVVLLGQYLSDRYNGHYYARAQNLARHLRAAYDQALEGVDVLLMPTTPMKAMRIPRSGDTAAYFASALGNIYNTCPFDVTGHPAISIPCGKAEGLPVGLMLIGRQFDETMVLRAAHGYERKTAG